jgi:hypothetical protein
VATYGWEANSPATSPRPPNMQITRERNSKFPG